MKRILAVIMIAVAFCLICACENHLPGDDEAASSGRGSAETTSNGTGRTIKPLEVVDFSVSDGKTIIDLDFPYADFETGLTEKEAGGSYVGETYSGEYAYKHFCHEYDDFDLYASNTNYDIKNRDFDEYFISQITLKTPVFKTHRGISVGSSAGDLIGLYGLGEEMDEDGKSVAVYTLNDMKMEFTIDENQNIQGISLYVVAEDNI